MSITIKIGADEDLETALNRFNNMVRLKAGRPWHKKRYGYYEKPSALGRKRKKMGWLRARAPSLKLHIGLAEQHQRTGPSNAAGR